MAVSKLGAAANWNGENIGHAYIPRASLSAERGRRRFVHEVRGRRGALVTAAGIAARVAESAHAMCARWMQ